MSAPGGSTNRDQIADRWPWGDVGKKWLYAFGIMLDGLAEWARQGMNAHMPGRCPPDALQYIGADRLIERGFAETDAGYSARLQRSFDTWALAGTAWRVLGNLLALVVPFAPIWRTVTSAGVWDSMNDPAAPATGLPTWRVYNSPSNWNWDGNTSNWWRFFTIVYPPSGLWTTGTTWGGGAAWGQYSGSWGLTASVGQVTIMRKVVSRFMPATRWCQWMIVSFDSTLFPPTATLPDARLPDGTWGPWSKLVGTTRVPTRNPNARYCDGPIP